MKAGLVLLTGQSHGRGEEGLHRERIPDSLKAFHGADDVSCQPVVRPKGRCPDHRIRYNVPGMSG